MARKAKSLLRQPFDRPNPALTDPKNLRKRVLVRAKWKVVPGKNQK